MESEEELKQKVKDCAKKMFEAQVWMLSDKAYTDISQDNFSIPFEKIPFNLSNPQRNIHYNLFWFCVCQARLQYGI